MLKLKTVSDVMPTRRDLLRYGGLGLAGATLGATWPPKVRAAETGEVNAPQQRAQCRVLRDLGRDQPPGHLRF